MSTAVSTTKERILDAAEDLMLAKSFHSVGLNEILSAVKVPKGSFYHYFTSKEQFGVELIRHYVSEATAFKRKMLLTEQLSDNAYERIVTFCNGAVARSAECSCQAGCLITKLCAEVATMSDDMRNEVAKGMKDWCDIYTQLVEEGQRQGVIRADLKPKIAGYVLHDVWLGAMQRMLVERNVAPLRNAAAFVQSYLAP
jgi:TetR/AcrR family transcriptional repressor of nem operon